MSLRPKGLLLKSRALHPAFGGVMVASLPALMLLLFWLGGEAAMILLALLLPAGLAVAAVARARRGAQGAAVSQEDDLLDVMSKLVTRAQISERQTACILVALDRAADLTDRFGGAALDDAMARLLARLGRCLREQDHLQIADTATFCVVLSPVPTLSLDDVLRLADRLQATVEGGVTGTPPAHLTASVGVSLSGNLRRRSATALLDAAQIALDDAQQHGPAAVRVHCHDMRGTPKTPLCPEIATALDIGEIRPWYQPQISTETGHITGVEALARWCHPTRGMIAPAGFLPALEDAGRLGKLGRIMLDHALSDLRKWDAAGLHVPHVSLNSSPEKLRNPRLADQIGWTLDRHGITPDRLCIELLETVVASAADDDIVARTIGLLAAMGCRIDLDDFGTGHASISTLRGVDVHRLKIDRSFVSRLDREPRQQRLVSAILLMAEQLDLDTLAEGVETPAEHALLAQLGCRHVQGFGIARPMPADQCADWIAAHAASIPPLPLIQRGIG